MPDLQTIFKDPIFEKHKDSSTESTFRREVKPVDTSWLLRRRSDEMPSSKRQPSVKSIEGDIEAWREEYKRSGESLLNWSTREMRMQSIEFVKKFHRIFGDTVTATTFGPDVLDQLPKRKLPKGYEGVLLNREGKYIDIYGNVIPEPPEYHPPLYQLSAPEEEEMLSPEGFIGPYFPRKDLVQRDEGERLPGSQSITGQAFEFLSGFEDLGGMLTDLISGTAGEREFALNRLLSDAAWWVPFIGPQSGVIFKGLKTMVKSPFVAPRKLSQGVMKVMPPQMKMKMLAGTHGLWERLAMPLHWRGIPTLERGPLKKKSLVEIFQPAVERMDKPTAAIFRKMQAKKALSTEVGKRLGGSLQGLTPRERYDVLDALRRWRPGQNLSLHASTGRAREVLSEASLLLDDFHIRGTYREWFDRGLVQHLKKRQVSALVGRKESPLFNRIVDKIERELEGTRDYKKIQKYLSEKLDSGALTDLEKLFFRDLHSVSASTPTAVATASKYASRKFLVGELKKTGVASTEREAGKIVSKYPGLKGLYVPRDVELELRALDYMPKISHGWYNKFFMTPWKTMKVVLRPATHIRNTLSNMILNDIGGLPFYRLDYYYKAVEEMKRQGPIWKKWQRMTGGGGTFSVSEVTHLHDGVKYHVEKAGKGFLVEKHTGAEWMLSQFDSIYPVQRLRQLYNAEEQLAKMAKFMWNMEKHEMPVEEAVLDAMKWTFNYGEVTRAVGLIRNTAAPFFTWQAKVLPLMAEAAVRNPVRLFKWPLAFMGMHQLAIDRADISDNEWEWIHKMLPQYVRDGQFMMIPWRDEKRRLQLLNMTYLLPGFGDLNDLQTSPIAWALGNPLVTIAGDLSRNKSFSGAPIWHDWDHPGTKFMKGVRHTWDQAFLSTNWWRKVYDTYQEHPDALTWEQLAATASGFKIKPVDPVKAAHQFKAIQDIHKAQEGSWLRKEIRQARSPHEREAILRKHRRNLERMNPFH